MTKKKLIKDFQEGKVNMIMFPFSGGGIGVQPIHWSPFNTGTGKSYIDPHLSKSVETYEYHLAFERYLQKKEALEQLKKVLPRSYNQKMK